MDHRQHHTPHDSLVLRIIRHGGRLKRDFPAIRLSMWHRVNAPTTLITLTAILFQGITYYRKRVGLRGYVSRTSGTEVGWTWFGVHNILIVPRCVKDPISIALRQLCHTRVYGAHLCFMVLRGSEFCPVGLSYHGPQHIIHNRSTASRFYTDTKLCGSVTQAYGVINLPKSQRSSIGASLPSHSSRHAPRHLYRAVPTAQCVHSEVSLRSQVSYQIDCHCCVYLTTLLWGAYKFSYWCTSSFMSL